MIKMIDISVLDIFKIAALLILCLVGLTSLVFMYIYIKIFYTMQDDFNEEFGKEKGEKDGKTRSKFPNKFRSL